MSMPRDIWEGNVITRSEIQTKNIRSLGLWDLKGRGDIKEVVIQDFRVYLIGMWVGEDQRTNIIKAHI